MKDPLEILFDAMSYAYELDWPWQAKIDAQDILTRAWDECAGFKTPRAGSKVVTA